MFSKILLEKKHRRPKKTPNKMEVNEIEGENQIRLSSLGLGAIR